MVLPLSGRGVAPASRMEEHLQATAKRLKRLGIGPQEPIASALPDGPDATSARQAHPHLFSLPLHASRGEYESLLLRIHPKLLLVLSGEHPAREAAHSLDIPVANLLRHYEAGIFTLEIDTPFVLKKHTAVPVVLIAPDSAYRGLANRLDAIHPVIGITPPRLEDLPAPHTVEHIATECVRILRRYRPQGPYALAGWRADSVVALEMARLLEEAGEKVVLVALLECKRLTPSANPWFGRVLHLRPRHERESHDSIAWRHIIPQGVVTYDAPSEMLAEPNVQIVATILAAELHS